MPTGSKKLIVPSLSVTLPYFLLSSISLFTISVLLYFAIPSLHLHYFQPILLCITHIAVLGFISSIIFGSIYQMHGIIFEVNIYSDLIAKISFVSLLMGMILLCISFYNFSMDLVCQSGAILVLLSFILFAVNFFLAIRESKENHLETEIISTSVIWLLATGIVGVLLVFNFTYVFIPKSHLEILTIHAHLGFVGWIVLLTIGVSSKVIPMFYLAEKTNKKSLKISYLLINCGLILLSVSIYWQLNKLFKIASSILLAAGILFFLYFVMKAFIKRNRKHFDIGINLTAISLFFLFMALPIGVLFSFEIMGPKTTIMLTVVYGILFIIGFCGTIIIGQALKIIPFMLWINKYQHLSGTTKIPKPKELISQKAALWTTIFFIGGALTLCLSYIIKFDIGAKFSALLLIIASILFNYNIFRAMLSKKGVQTP